MSTSKLQRHTGKQLRHRFSKYGIVENTRPSWLISTKGERLELDFYLEHLGIAVEVQGRQHFELTPVFHATKWDFQEQLRRDREKLEICQRVGIDLLYVCKKSDVEIVLMACYDAFQIQSSNDSERNWVRIPEVKKSHIVQEYEYFQARQRLKRTTNTLTLYAKMICNGQEFKPKSRKKAMYCIGRVNRILAGFDFGLSHVEKYTIEIVSNYINKGERRRCASSLSAKEQ